jgi:hypothetical protein
MLVLAMEFSRGGPSPSVDGPSGREAGRPPSAPPGPEK